MIKVAKDGAEVLEMLAQGATPVIGTGRVPAPIAPTDHKSALRRLYKAFKEYGFNAASVRELDEAIAAAGAVLDHD